MPTKELWFIRKPKLEEAFLAVVIMGIVFVQNITMLDVWGSILNLLERLTGTNSYYVIFTVAFFIAMFIPVALLSLTGLAAKQFNSDSVRQNFTKFGYAIIPLDVAAHVAHNMFHLLAEGKAVFYTAMILGGQEIRQGVSPALLDVATIQFLQYLLIGLGIAGSLYTAYRIARSNYMGKTTGNMSPPQLDWAMSQLRAWSRRLQLDAVPRSPEGFFVDVAGKTGLGRRTGNDSGSMLRYLDTTPLAESLERAIAALRQAESTDQGPAGPINQLRIAILDKVRPAVAPNVDTELRKDPRIACTVSARVRIGLGRICRELATKGLADAPADGAGEQIEVYAVSDGRRARRQAPDEHDSLALSLSSFSDPMCRLGCRQQPFEAVCASTSRFPGE